MNDRKENDLKKIIAILNIVNECVVKQQQCKQSLEKKNEKKQENKHYPEWKRFCMLRHCGRSTDFVMRELNYDDASTFRHFNQMSPQTFHKLLAILRPRIERRDTHLRRAIRVETRLLAVLRYLSTGDSLASLASVFCLSKPVMSRIIRDVLNAITKSLTGTYLKLPQTQDEWSRISEKFEETWNFPNCLGALVGKYIEFKLKNSDTEVASNGQAYKSIMMFALVDANRNFLHVDICPHGRENDASIFNESSLCRSIEEKSLNIPPDRNLQGGSEKMPYVMAGNDAFELKDWLMNPNKENKSMENMVFNYRLNRARSVAEDTFHILVNRFHVLQSQISLQVNKVEKLTYALCALHNFLKIEDKEYMDGMDDVGPLIEENCPKNIGPVLNATVCQSAKEIRNRFTTYFNTTGALDSQWEAANNM